MQFKPLLSIIIITIVFFLGIKLGHYFYQDEIEDSGKVYPSKSNLCVHFAQSYLRTIPKTDNITDFGSEKWEMAIDVETEIYDLCLIDLNKDILKNYKPTVLEKYQK